MMKFSLSVLAAILAVSPLFAQPESPQTQTALKPAEASPLSSPVPANAPSNQVADFFRILIEGRVDAAYDQILKGTPIAQMPKDVATLKTKTREALRVFGDLNGYDLVDVKMVGHSLVRATCLSLGKQFPIRWRFYFYSTNAIAARSPEGATWPNATMTGTWKLIDIRIDDRLVDMFDESAPVLTGTAK